MSDPTLSYLKADYEAAVSRLNDLYHTEHYTAHGWLKRLGKLLGECHSKQAIFEIARDFGHDRAMLFKLSDGNMDPRKAADE